MYNIRGLNSNNTEKFKMKVSIFTKMLNFDQLFHIVTGITTKIFFAEKLANRSRFKKIKKNYCGNHGNTGL